ncbi:B3/B4 domain-containing protein [Microlunatus soli]|uniref:B3/B4 domain-containing protein (DNA/RNA-binding domain of Phe-tRNA-synthetase) n=1 Tax=Microlunatus soli TaxID=630515 RepID=A0A1H2A809_9ACTN|nr:phenylalanine--tRNA ligase beta subunit-related protein [Microlunatus soli]SDT42115.1 B3/B4 domain-containing protein (DNA/RNA-binding domain of Phe-tRNA-synthetase) [Microlunatus soli]
MSTFGHEPAVWQRFPALAVGVLWAAGVSGHPGTDSDFEAELARIVRDGEVAAAGRLSRSANHSESGLTSIAAWRRVYADLGYKPTQYRCAAESLLRRIRQQGTLPRVHPLVDVCNAASAAHAIPVAVLDRDRIVGDLRVGFATGAERYRTFDGTEERPRPGEVIYRDSAGSAHARRWVNRQSATSAVGPGTGAVLIVAEAVHASAAADVGKLIMELRTQLELLWATDCAVALPTANDPIVQLNAGGFIP